MTLVVIINVLRQFKDFYFKSIKYLEEYENSNKKMGNFNNNIDSSISMNKVIKA